MSQNRKQRRSNQSRAKSGPYNNDPALQALLNEAFQHHQAGWLAEAERLYRQILTLDPGHADSLHLVGVLAHQVGNPDAAIELIRKAIASQGDVSFYYNSLGNVLKDQNKLNEAVAAYRHALAIRKDDVEALNNLGVALDLQGKHSEAVECFKRAIALKPDYFEAVYNLGNIFSARGDSDDALACYKRAIDLNPGLHAAYNNLGIVLKNLNRFDEALAHFNRALALKPDDAEAHYNAGGVLMDRDRPLDAIAHLRSAIHFDPGYLDSYILLGQCLRDHGKLDDAVACYRRALEVEPSATKILNNLGGILTVQGKPEEAIACYRKALAFNPDLANVQSNLLFAMIYAASVSPEELAAEAKAFGERFADPLLRKHPLRRDADPERKLRIGYVSPDFRNHSVNYFFEPLLKLHNRQQFEIFAYSSTPTEDAVTARLKQAFDHWRDIKTLSDDEAAGLIETDKIDILVDPAGHTGNNRLLVFARKPAPVQMTWLGFPATTGMKAMDYRITDSYAEPEGMTENLNVETLWRLPEIFCCYGAHESNPAVIDHPPFEDNGYITFGCFNNFAKVTDPVLETWAKIMKNVPGSRLLLEIGGLENPQFRREIETRLRHFGLPLERVILEPRKKSNQFVLYNKIDLALDPFPCAGGTTSMDTLWMGVPFVTLAGKHFVSRMGVTFLTNVGLPDLIAHNVDEYVQLAADLANDRERLRAIRHNLRDKVIASPLMDQERFTRNMEAAYRNMWRKWCEEAVG